MTTDEMVAWLEGHGHDVLVICEGEVVAIPPGKTRARAYRRRAYGPMVGGAIGSDSDYWRIEQP